MQTHEIETKVLIEAIALKYGYDFSRYTRSSIQRRFDSILDSSGCDSISHLQHKILHDPGFFDTVLNKLTVTTSDMFRDPSFFRVLRNDVIPILKTYPHVRIWNAGCSTGEEVYSTAILLKEEGLYERCTIYATDINQEALRQAKAGIFPIDRVKQFTSQYQRSGGRTSFSEYYTAAYDSVRMDSELKRNLTFLEHNLVTDGVFMEAHLILCRNVFIYFDRPLQEVVARKFTESLVHRGFLCLGHKETLRFLKQRECYDEFNKSEKIYQKRREALREQ